MSNTPSSWPPPGPGSFNSGGWDSGSQLGASAAFPGQVGVLVTIGDITCTQFQVITPSGECPIGVATWTFTDMSRTTKFIPTWAIVCAIIFFVFCLLGLLFLLVKEERTEGAVQIVVQAPGMVHQIQLPVSSVAQVQDYSARIGYARSLTAAAGRPGTWTGGNVM